MLKNVIATLLLSTSLAATAASTAPIVIAHRGASGYLPEHSLPAKAMAYAQGADYLEQDLVMTKDDRLVVLHDHYLDRVTDVATRFPQRARADGRYYAIDFTLAEIKSLKFSEGFEIENGKKVQTFPGRFPMGKIGLPRAHLRGGAGVYPGSEPLYRQGHRYLYRDQSTVVPS